MIHRYQVTAEYGQATIYKCARCGASRHYSWMPGWPGVYEHFNAAGESIEREEPCSGYPNDGRMPTTIILGEK